MTDTHHHSLLRPADGRHGDPMAGSGPLRSPRRPVISVFEGHRGPSGRLQLPLLHLHLTNVSPTFTRSSSPSQHGLGVAAGVRGVAQMKEKDFIVR
ncbi:unnamed protein product [Arctogadus glacialis]